MSTRTWVLTLALAACNGRPESRPAPAPAAPVAPAAPAPVAPAPAAPAAPSPAPIAPSPTAPVPAAPIAPSPTAPVSPAPIAPSPAAPALATPAAPSPADPKDAAMPTTILRPIAIPALGIDALVPAGELREDTVDGTVSARIVDGPVRYAFSKGPGATLGQLRAGLPGQVTFEPEADARLCGQPARRLVANMIPPIGTGARRGPDGQLEHQPGGGEPTTFVAIATQRNGTWIRAVWIVATARRADHAADEAHFFVGLRCR
jgi:hypothetical protein